MYGYSLAMQNRWKRDGDTAIVKCAHGSWWAWNNRRGHLAVLPEDDSRVGFATLEELEAALRADGWEIDNPR